MEKDTETQRHQPGTSVKTSNNFNVAKDCGVSKKCISVVFHYFVVYHFASCGSLEETVPF